MHSFEELDAWKIARDFKTRCKTLASSFPKSEEYRLKDQIYRASRSVTANIAEGFGRFHHQENIQFCRQARGSLTEILDHFIEARDCGYIDEEQLKEVRKTFEKCVLVLNGYIAYLKKAKATQ